MKQHLLCCICFFIVAVHLHAGAQPLSGIWSGKISRTTKEYRGVESLEIKISQTGKRLYGYSLAFKDTSRFVLYGLEGNKNKKQQSIEMYETGSAVFILPREFLPCQKFYDLKYYKIGKTQYLSGKWTGAGEDTSCFPGEELLVVLQKVKTSDYTINKFMQKKITEFYTQRQVPDEAAEPAVVETIPVKKVSPDSVPAERKIDIQEIIKVKDSSIRVYLYDNAVVDDDTVTVFVDKNPVLVKQRISAKALIFEIKLHDIGKPVEIMLQAENLGSIPPNTALMVVETGRKRYEVRLSASFEKHAVVIVTFDPEE